MVPRTKSWYIFREHWNFAKNEPSLTQLSYYFGLEWILQDFDLCKQTKLSHFWATGPIFWAIVKIFQDFDSYFTWIGDYAISLNYCAIFRENCAISYSLFLVQKLMSRKFNFYKKWFIIRLCSLQMFSACQSHVT